MPNVTKILAGHPLVGRWRTEEDDARTEYEISADLDGLKVTGRDYIDGEDYEISDVKWTKNLVEFKTHMPSTGRRGHIVLSYVEAMRCVTMTFTFTDTCMAYKVV
ncbi:hypothetical protein [Microvirga lotononidis]|uniref:hypothetical protein n=1 Tax=Microvirga lotononidis TaxID=864069 RepID=UPI0012B577F7|nr:hypothetical protein [Microvirga lotononidis]WQO28947.1 hypothetical protein U0023_07705 [Microvirga lotononidis]